MTPEGCGNQIAAAIEAMRRYVSEVTGESPTDTEIARALTRYFVLREICGHIKMQRDNPEKGPSHQA